MRKCRERISVLFMAKFFFVASLYGENIAQKVESAHGLNHWWSTQVLRADIEVVFGGKTYLEGTVYFETNGSRARLELKSGELVVFDGKTCWLSPSDSPYQRARFDVLTWSWFMVAPFKIRGDGTKLTAFEKINWDGKSYWAATQTFDSDAGDTPDDWYFLYVDPETYLLKGMGYIVTYGQSLEEANKEPHGIIYRHFENVDGVMLSTQWRFGHFSKEQGIDDTLGSASLKNVKCVSAIESLFQKPPHAREEKAPEKKG